MQPLGLSPQAEAAYRALLRAPGMNAAELQATLGGPLQEVEALLASLLARGLVSRSHEAAERWMPATPEVAVELLLMERQVELNQARQVLPELQQDLLRGGGHADVNDVQVITGGAAAQLPVYLQIHQLARQEVACVLIPPFLVSAPDAMEAAREQARRRGVRYRTLVAPEMLQWPGWPASIRQALASGEQVRVLAHLPFKMVLADRSWGLVPLRLDMPNGPVLKLGRTAALEALWLLFESLWEQAAPVLDVSGAAVAEEAAEDPAQHELRTLVTLMAAGSNDKTIADVLGISERTLLRRINTLSTRLRARSRFQCGWLAAQQWGRDKA